MASERTRLGAIVAKMEMVLEGSKCLLVFLWRGTHVVIQTVVKF